MERDQALDAAVSQIERQFGKGAIMKMGEASHVDIDSVSTGALSLDLGLGIGGLPRGRVVEVFGPESSGKTTLCYHVIAEAQRKGGLAAFIDAEHAMVPTYAQRIGVNVDELLLSQPDNGEQALEIAEMLIRSGALDVLVIDSVAALVPRAGITVGASAADALRGTTTSGTCSWIRSRIFAVTSGCSTRNALTLVRPCPSRSSPNEKYEPDLVTILCSSATSSTVPSQEMPSP